MLSGLFDELHDFSVILLSLANQIVNIVITYLFSKYGYQSYYKASITFVILTIISQAIIFTLRFVPKHFSCLKSMCHFLFYIIIGSIISPITSIIIYFMEVYLQSQDDSSVNKAFFNYNSLNRQKYATNKCYRPYGCIYIQYHESVLNQWMHFKFMKLCGFMSQLIVDTLPHLIIQLTFLLKKHAKSSENKHDILQAQNMTITMEVSIMIGILCIMVKTFIFGSGITNKLYIFHWICYITDFINLVFIILFVFFVSNSEASETGINSVEIGYLGITTADNAISWIFMITLSYILIPMCALFAMYKCGELFMNWFDNNYYDEWYIVLFCCPCGVACWFLGVGVFAAVGVIILMFINTSIIGLRVRGTQQRFKYISRLQVNQMVNNMISFMNHDSTDEEIELYSYPNNDKVIRILSVNRAYHTIKFAGMSYSDDWLFKKISEISKNHSWDRVTETDLRRKGYGYRNNQVSIYRYEFLNEYASFVLETYHFFADVKSWPIFAKIFLGIFPLIGVLLLTIFHVLTVGFFISRLLVPFYPLIALLGGNYDRYLGIHWCILIIFSGLYVGILVLLFGHVLPIVKVLNMIRPNDGSINLTLKSNSPEEFERKINICYGMVQLSKYIQEVLIERFGDDVALIIVEYAFDEWMVKK